MENELFDRPYGVAVDGCGSTLYVADTGNCRIQIFRLRVDSKNRR